MFRICTRISYSTDQLNYVDGKTLGDVIYTFYCNELNTYLFNSFFGNMLGQKKRALSSSSTTRRISIKRCHKNILFCEMTVIYQATLLKNRNVLALGAPRSDKRLFRFSGGNVIINHQVRTWTYAQYIFTNFVLFCKLALRTWSKPNHICQNFIIILSWFNSIFLFSFLEMYMIYRLLDNVYHALSLQFGPTFAKFNSSNSTTI